MLDLVSFILLHKEEKFITMSTVSQFWHLSYCWSLPLGSDSEWWKVISIWILTLAVDNVIIILFSFTRAGAAQPPHRQTVPDSGFTLPIAVVFNFCYYCHSSCNSFRTDYKIKQLQTFTQDLIFCNLVYLCAGLAAYLQKCLRVARYSALDKH